MNCPPIAIFASDDPLLKNERSESVIAAARKELPDAQFMIFTNSDFQTTGDANLKVLENELIDPGLFGGDRIIKIYLKEMNKTASQVLMLIAQRIRPGVVIVVDLPRIQASYAKLPAKPYQALEKKTSALKTVSEAAVSFIKGRGGILEIIYPPEGEELVRWIIGRAQKYKLGCNKECAQYMAANFDGNLVSIAQILELISMTSPNAMLTPQLLDRYALQDSRFSGFEIAEAILSGNGIRALNALNTLCQGSSALAETTAQVISQLDNALSAIPVTKSANPSNMDYRSRTSFFSSLGIRSLNMQQAVTKAAFNMPDHLYDYLSEELSKASKFWSTFRFNEALQSLQNMCAVVMNFNVMAFKPLRDI